MKMILCLLLVVSTLSAQTPIFIPPTKIVLIEEFTTCSCGMCPPASYNISSWVKEHHEKCILMVIHEGSGQDAMSSSLTSSIFSEMRPSGSWWAPAVMIDRTVFPQVSPDPYLSCANSFDSKSAPGIDSLALKLMVDTAAVEVEIAYNYDSLTRQIEAEVRAKFYYDVDKGDMRLNLFLVEDSVVGTPKLGCFKGWDQKCYDGTWANEHYPGKYDGTYIIGYPHRKVMRTSFFSTWGASGIIPQEPFPGINYKARATIKLDSSYNDKKLSLIGFVSYYGPAKNQRSIINAYEVSVRHQQSLDVNENSQLVKTDLSVNPNPAKDIIKIKLTGDFGLEGQLSITDIFGNSIKSNSVRSLTSDNQEFIFDTSEFAKGIYFAVFKYNNCAVIRKFLIE